MYLMNYMGLPAYFGATFATIVGMSIAVFIAMRQLRKEYNFKYQEIFSVLKKTLVPLVVMILLVVVLKMFIPVNYASRVSCIIFIFVIVVIATLVYFIISYKIGLFKQVLGEDFIKKMRRKFKKKKEV
ncbi:MAG: polysaccharide biosynthesis C-terminal domain-containing protein [Bacilli bacterium]|nr:polysaccharide biosynthesis C-terminal domain-containing protein [Bacilli bacterium]